MAETKSAATRTVSYRVSEDVKSKMSDLMSTTNLTAEGLFTALIAAYEKENFGNSAYGAAMQNDLDAWAMHSAALQQLFQNAIRTGIDAKEIVRKELLGRIEASEASIAGYKEKLEKAEEEKNDLTVQLDTTKRSLDEARRDIEKAEEESSQARDNAEAWKNSINSLTSQLDEYKDKVSKYDDIQMELAKAKADLLAAQSENKVLKGIIDKYMNDGN